MGFCTPPALKQCFGLVGVRGKPAATSFHQDGAQYLGRIKYDLVSIGNDGV